MNEIALFIEISSRFRPIVQSQPLRLIRRKSILRRSLTDGTPTPRISWATQTVARTHKLSSMSPLNLGVADLEDEEISPSTGKSF